ncbi:MAG: aminotransferase class I/II-fold pyridoxal phosphate-dependent enzyme [bacterium]
MSLEKFNQKLKDEIQELEKKGRAKGKEKVIKNVIRFENKKGPRYILEGYENKEFIRMNSNSYLSFSLRKELIQAEVEAAEKFGVGPGAVRFISGTYSPHVELESKLADFHSREAGMIFSSAYVTSMGVIAPLTDTNTVIISDELNHNCIINAIRLSRPAAKEIYKHNDMQDMQKKIELSLDKGNRLLMVTDGIFSMRGDHAPLDTMKEICKKYNNSFDDGVIIITDDSHGVGAFGRTGRGVEEYTNTRVDVLIGTLGKAFGVNGGYVVSSSPIIRYLREHAPMYIYSNPITASEAQTAIKAVDILNSKQGLTLLENLRKMIKKFRDGVKAIGFKTIDSEHPIVPLVIGDTTEAIELTTYLNQKGVLVTDINYPVVPKGEDEIRFQITAEHTPQDIDTVLKILEDYPDR